MTKKYPFYLKSTVILFGLTLFVYALLNLREILVPLAFALLISILLNPIVSFLQRHKMPHMVAIIIAMFVAFLVFVGVGYFLSSQIMGLRDELPLIEKKMSALFSQIQTYAQQHLGMDLNKQNQMLDEAKTNIKPVLAQTLGSLLGTLAVTFLLPVYTFLFLYYKTLLLNFFYEVFAEENIKEVDTVVHQTKSAIQNYMVGLMVEGTIVAALNTTALLILGVKYAVLLGVLGAILNVLPFIGGILSVLLPIIMVTATKDGFSTQIALALAYMLIQFIDNHFLIPWVVSSRVKINAIISIVIVLMGGAVWGISGMFLSIPFIGVTKLIFDRIPDLKPWGRLLGDQIPTRHKGEIFLSRRRRPKEPQLVAKE